MATFRTWRAATCHIGTLMAESFCERVLSCANLVVTDGNTLLDDPEVTDPGSQRV